MADHTEVAPQLPPASVDFNALHKACIAGASAEDAAAKAIVAETVYTPDPAAPETPAPDEGAEAADESVGLTKRELRAILDERGVAYETDANLDRLQTLVRDNPAPPPSPPPAGETDAAEQPQG